MKIQISYSKFFVKRKERNEVKDQFTCSKKLFTKKLPKYKLLGISSFFKASFQKGCPSIKHYAIFHEFLTMYDHDD